MWGKYRVDINLRLLLGLEHNSDFVLIWYYVSPLDILTHEVESTLHNAMENDLVNISQVENGQGYITEIWLYYVLLWVI